MDWSKNFPAHFAPKTGEPAEGAVAKDSGKKIEFADIGCGYGGLLVALSTVYPDTLMLGKSKVVIADYTNLDLDHY
jgi:tRNA (guanine-N7-)-methyltransferase